MNWGGVRDRLTKAEFACMQLKSMDLAGTQGAFDGRRHSSQSETVSSPKAVSGHLELRLGRRQFSRDHCVGEPAGLVAAVAEWLIGGLPAAAQADGGPASKPKRLPVWIDDLEIALDAKRSIMIHSDLGCRHFFSLDLDKIRRLEPLARAKHAPTTIFSVFWH